MSSETAKSEGQVVLETVQWSSLQFIENIDPISNRDYAVLNELREVLVRTQQHFQYHQDQQLM